MTNADTALTHLVEPGEYQVRWMLPGVDGVARTVIGTITLAAQAMPSGSIVFDNVPLDWGEDGASFPQTFTYEFLHGTLSTNQDIVLLDAAIEVWFPGRAHVSARGAVAGLLDGNFSGEVTALQFQTTYLDRLLDFAPITSFAIPEAGGPVEWRVTQAESLGHSWSSDAVSLNLEYLCRAGVGDPYEMHVRYSALGTVRLVEPISVDKAISDWLVPAQALATLAVGRRADITWAAVGVASADGDKTSWMQLYGGGLAQSPHNAAGRRSTEPNPALRFGAASHSMLKMLQVWQNKQNDGEPLFETYVSVLGVPKDHPRNRMLLLVQAIEGHYGSVHQQQLDQENDTHKLERKKHLAAVKASALNADTKKFIGENLTTRPIRSLNTVLDWAVGTLPGNLGAKFATLTIIEDVINGPDTTVATWQDALRTIRNHLAHGNRSYERGPLRQLADLLDKVVRALVFASVGANPAVIENILGSEH